MRNFVSDIDPKLTRFAYTPLATFGILSVGDFWCYSIECPWLSNKRDISCIPEGSYFLELGLYKNRYGSYEVMDVPDRDYIKIHIGNTLDDIIGCIVIGNKLGVVNGKWGVLQSKITYEKFMTAMNNTPFSSIVINWDKHVRRGKPGIEPG